ncbi:MAG TPA: Do family serine endopeptidase [Kiritimatiellia bacterium]|nr:Do family serine endopeptidase [Kiritimatiellia bacterium]HOM58444.1 Do family serine endopeptidase [Kiritimatiellia bacterium]HOR97595.1 Do family serine endopeptidase [Kiritimatiellia bacterium]HPC48557.1 Do family serine endopeptidase [Kiritimatiellia bacterium]HPK37734.1 Do family serine endopeptidase [Kiritimatiellia bacterium]
MKRSKRRFGVVALLVLALVLSFPHGAARAAGVLDFRQGFSGVASKATAAVVFIQVEKQVPAGNMQYYFNNPYDLFGEEFFERFFGRRQPRQQMPRRRQPQQMFKQTGQGSGFLISKDGYILTNTHVVGDVDKITVRLSDGREFAAKRIGADVKTEVALIKIEAKEDLPYLEIGKPEELKIGEWVIAIGNPFGLKETLTVGVVSAKGRSNIGITDYEDFIQTDAAINPGNSGGPLLNIDGKVVGINTAIYSRSGGYMGIGFAVPIDMAVRIKDQLIATGKVTRGYVGVFLNPGEVTREMAASFGRSEAGGVLIAEVQKDGPADKAGIKSGDILIELNGKKIVGNTDFRNDVARIMPNEKAEVLLFRDGKTRKVTVTVAAFPEDEQGTDAGGESGGAALLEKLGLQVQDLTQEIAQQLGYENLRGVVISDVMQGSVADEAGLRPGMLILEVNRAEVKNARQFEAAVGKAKGSNVLVRVKTKEGTIFLNLPTQE